MPTTDTNTRWTVIPRGLSKDGKHLTFAVAVTPVPADSDAATIPTDADPWNQWLANCGNAAGQPCSVTVQAGGRQISIPNVTLPALPNVDYDTTALWAKLLAYSNASWAGAGTQAAGPDTQSTSIQLAADPNACTATTRTADLHQHMNHIQAAGVLAARRRRPNGGDDSAGCEPSAATTMGQGAKKLAAEQAIRKSIHESLRTHLGGLSYLALPAQRGLHSVSAAAADCFRAWLKTELASSDPLRRLKARAAERNLYRLSGNPYNTLAADVFATVVQLAGGTLNCPGVHPATSRRAHLIQHSIFHRRYQAKNTPGIPRKPRDEAPATLQDFYRTLNLISRYPELLHPLGLAFDFNSVDFSAANLDGNTPFTVTFRAPSSLKQEPTIIYTSCSGDGFATSPSRVIGDFVIAGGMLALNNCQAVTRDIDGESLRTAHNSHVINSTNAKNTAEAAAPAPPQPGAADANEPDNTTNPDRDTTLPMRTIGVSLVHPDAPDHIHNRLQTSFTQRQSATTANAAAAGTPPASITLGLNDLVRGFTVRIRREGEKNALSLTSRSVTYTLTAKNGSHYHLVNDQRDFPIELSATTTHDSATPQAGTQTGVPDLHLHPALFRYTGWGLTVETPFPRTQPTTDKTPPTPPIPTSYNPPANDGLRWPRFRYGTHYIQLQTMDLLCTPIQGGSTPPYLDANHKALPSQTELSFQYLRSDPVHGPTLLLQLTDSPKFQPDTYKECFRLGESMGCMVLHDGEFQPLTRRVLVPPVASLDQLLPHGVLDDDRGLKRDLNSIGTFDDVAILDSGDFPAVTNPPHKDPNHPNDPTKLVKSKKTAPIYIKPDRTPPSRTYLPDPMAQHLVAEIIDLSDPAQTIIDSSALDNLQPGDFYPIRSDGTRPAWPNAVRLAVQMAQPTDKSRPTAQWNLDEHNQVMTLYVGIPEGWQVKLHLKCTPSRRNAKEVFELPSSLKNTGDEKWIDTIGAQIDDGTAEGLNNQLKDIDDNARRLALGHIDQLTPSTELLLIHSVKQPLNTSAIDQPPIDPKTGKRTGKAVQVQQFYDSPLVQFSLAVNIGDRRSTGKVELVADWTDIVDTPSNTTPPPSTKDDGHNRAFPQQAHIKQWPLSLQANTDARSNGQKDQQKFSSIAQTFPDTKYRIIHLSVNAISRFVPYYVPASAKNSDETAYTLHGASTDTVNVELQNTARLDPPRLNRIMPLRWTHRQHFRDGTTCSTHFGAGFRILIDRPFNGTPATDGGQGELLGITLWGESFPSPQTTNYDSAITFAPSAYHSWAADDALQPYVTRWGADPGLSTGNLPSPSPISPQFHHPTIQPQTEEQRKNDEPQIPAAADIAKCAFPADLPLAYDTQPQQCDPTSVPYFTVAKYPVQWDNEEKLWYSDVQLTAPPVIKDKDRKASPTDGIPAGFIRFALIRYQPNSLINRECSRVTIAPLTPIPPHRELWFNKRQGSTIKLQIDGTTQDPNATTTRRDFQVELQRRSFFSSRRKNRWETVDIPGQDTTPQPFHTGLHYSTLATWSLTLKPVWFWPWSHVYRIIVREYETLFADTEGNRGARAIKQRLVDTFIEGVP